MTQNAGNGSETPFVPAIRRAFAEDATFLAEMLAVAADWRPGARVRPAKSILREPALAHYVAGWPGDRDAGYVAEDMGRVGAAWWRFLPKDDPGYGFVDAATPELSIGVIAEARGRGIGTLLLEALIDEARQRNLPALSLSVEPDNPAAGLYHRLGFVTVGRVGGSLTMLLHVFV